MVAGRFLAASKLKCGCELCGWLELSLCDWLAYCWLDWVQCA